MAHPKTKKTRASVKKFLDAIEDEGKRKDSHTVLEMIKAITGEDPKMWVPTIVGFGSYHYRYASGREGDGFLTGFSPRKRNLTLYIMSGFSEQGRLLKRLGRFKTGKSCLYINKLDDVDPRGTDRTIGEAKGGLAGRARPIRVPPLTSTADG